jgi:catechol 2,3-dioxygenase-like lactoylglutathione lyase family enzyme
MGLELVSVIVRDYDEAIAFFVDALGFFVAEDSPSLDGDGQPKRWVVVKSPGSSSGILLAQARGDEQVALIGRQFAGRVGLFLRVDDFDEAFARMSSYGVEFLTAPRAEPYGRVAVFMDLCGNKWDLLGPSTVSAT